ncbi:MAG: oligosaccharide flippase family protein [Halolamina sp.]
MSIGDTDFGVQVSIGVVGRVLMMFVAFLGAVLLARLLGPGGYGSFYLLMAIVSFLSNPIKGWANGCRKRLTEHGFPGGEAIGSTLFGLALATVVVAVSAWAAGPVIDSYVRVDDAWVLLVVLFAGMATYLSAIELLKTSSKFGLTNWVMAGRDIVRVLLQAGLVLAGFSVAGMVGGMVVANFLVLPVVLYLLSDRIQRPTRETLGEVWTFARLSIPDGVVGTAQSRMDVLLLGALASTSVVGHYEVAMRITMPAMFVAGVASGGLMGRISNRRSKDQDISQDIQRNLSYASIVAFPIFFGALGMGAPVVVTIFSSQYSDAGAFVAALALFHVFRSQKEILESTIDGFDRPDLNLRASTIVFTFNLVLGIGLYFAIGPIGVVYATVVSEMVGYGLRARHVQHLVPSISLVPPAVRDQVLSSIVMLAVVWGVRQLLALSWWAPVVFVLGAGGVTYFLTLTVVSEPFRGTVRAVARDSGLA